jgi:hypothetical protein
MKQFDKLAEQLVQRANSDPFGQVMQKMHNLNSKGTDFRNQKQLGQRLRNIYC